MELAALQSLALSVAQARSPDSVLSEMVAGLGMSEGVALARVWLIEQEEGVPRLELKASVGLSIAEPGLRWTRTDGAHQKIPLSYGKVGRIASTGQPLLLQKGPRDWLVQPDWAEREGIESFAGQPLVYRGEVLGVVAIFSRRRIEPKELSWLRVFADHAAVAIANARALQEIESLKERLERERDYLREEVREERHPANLVLESVAMRTVADQVRAAARADVTVLIHGESGVGKELVASAIHDQSARSEGPFVKVNCAAVPRELFESEFFGHVRGAFSGATKDRAGRFELAQGGTLFLDEVGEIPIELQGKLLRVLQEGEFEPVGSDRTQRVDVRIVTATNRELSNEVELGRFRRDLYYRLNVLPLSIPPLRERPADILPLARLFLEAISKRLNIRAPDLSSANQRALLAYDFPGNVRELRNIMERAVVLRAAEGSGPDLELSLPARASSAPPPIGPAATELGLGRVIPEAEWRELERGNIQLALDHCEGKVSGPGGAAELLGVKASTLSYRMQTLGIERRGA
jgi:transcriptional regulator with GAF, ATPase, and Fis domain